MKGQLIVNAGRMFVAVWLLSGLLAVSHAPGATSSRAVQTDSGGGVTVKVTLLDSTGNGDLRFQVVLDTHSVNLDRYDLKKLAVLRDDAGKDHLPKTVEGKGSGHHRQSTLVFAKMANSTKRVELVIKEIAGVKERIFRWESQ